MVTLRCKFQLWNPSWLYFQKLPYILQAYRHTCLQRNEAAERVSSRMVRTGKSVLFPQAHRKPFGWKATTARGPCWSPRFPCSCPPLAALVLYVNRSTIIAIILLILRSFQRKGLCDSSLVLVSIISRLSMLYALNGRKVTVWILIRYEKVKI